MSTRLKTYSVLSISAVLLIAMAFAGAASATSITSDQWNNLTITNGSYTITDGTAKIAPKNLYLSGLTLDGDLTLDFTGYTTGFEGVSYSWNYNIGALFGAVNLNNHKLEIKGLNMVSVKVAEQNGYCGGIIGKVSGTGILNFTNCHLVNCSIQGGNEYVGGLIGYVNSFTISLNIKDCSASYCDILDTGGSGVGGLSGESHGSTCFERCNVTNCTIYSSTQKAGGLAGSAYYSTFNQCGVENTMILAYNHGAAGGLAGQTAYSCKIANCYVANCVIAADSSSLGGLVGSSETSGGITGSQVLNCTIVNDGNTAPTNANIGGLVGGENVASPTGWSGNTVKNCAIYSVVTSNNNLVCGNKPALMNPLNCTADLNENFINNGTTYSDTITTHTVDGTTCPVHYNSAYFWYQFSYSHATSTRGLGTANVTNLGQYGRPGGYGVGSVTYTVTYDGNGNTGGSVPVDSTTYYAGDSVTVLGNTGNLEKTGYFFNGWNLGSTSGELKKAGDTFSITLPTTLYANWILPPYVEVNSWAGLNQSVSEWTDTTTARVVAVNASILDRGTLENQPGINVTGKVIVTTTSTVSGSEAIVDGQGQGRLFNVASTGNLTLIGNGTSVLNLTGGYLSGSTGGAGVYLDGGSLTLATGAKITNCTSVIEGAGVYINSASVFTMNGGSITGCNCTANGGGGVSDWGTFIMLDGSITDCRAGNSGGGVYVEDASFTMYNGLIRDCNAKNAGGGVDIELNGAFIMHDGTIRNCSVVQSGGGVSITGGAFTMNGGTVTECTVTDTTGMGGGILAGMSSTFTMNGGSISGNTASMGAETITIQSITLSGNAKIGGKDLGLVNFGSYPNITASSFTGSVANITLYQSTAENPSFWVGQVVVKNGASVKDKFALSSAYSGYQLLASGNDLILANTMPTGSLFVNITNANNNPVTLALNTTSGSNINTTTVAAGVTNITFSNLEDGSYSLYGSYVNGTATTAVNKLVTVSGGAGYVNLIFPQQNVSSVVNTSAESGASTPKVTVDGLDTLGAAESAPAADKKTVITFNAVGEVYNASNTNQTALKTNITANNPNAVISFLNFSVTKSTVNITTGVAESVTVISDPSTLLTIYMAYDMTNRQNIQVWRYHNGTAEQLQELASGAAPSDGTYTLDGTNGVFIYSQHFSSYAISSTTTSTPVTPSSGGSSSSHHSGSSQLAKSPTVTPTAEPTAVPTQTSTTVITSSPTASATSSTTPSSPAPVIGLIAGLGAAALVLSRLRK